MTNKVDKPRPDKAPNNEPSPPNAKVRKSNSGSHSHEDPPVASREPEVGADDSAPLPRRRSKGKTDVPMKNATADLQTRHDVIGAGLKRIFDEIVEEPIPPEFLELLDQIDRKREP